MTLGGVALDEIRVEFMPDPEQLNVGLTSVAETDASGKFVLVYGTDGQGALPGALVGWHRVVLWDYKAINSRDNPIDSRISDKFNLASKTPIAVEIKPGLQTVEINLDNYK